MTFNGVNSLNRRELLWQAARIAAVGALAPLGKLAAQSRGPQSAESPSTQPKVSPTMVRLSTYMAEAKGRVLPAEVVETAKHHILDTIAAMISGADLPPGRAALRFANESKGD